MMMTYAEDEQQRIDFAKSAARWFAENPKGHTYTAGEIETGALFAMRYGLGDDCVVVFRISHDTPVVNFQNLIRGVE